MEGFIDRVLSFVVNTLSLLLFSFSLDFGVCDVITTSSFCLLVFMFAFF